MNRKEFFQKMEKDITYRHSSISDGFPSFCLKIFWDGLSEDEIQDATEGLKTNDESIDAFFIDKENKEINIIQCKSCLSVQKMQAVSKNDLSFLNEVETKLEDFEFINSHKNKRIKEIATEFALYKKSFRTKKHFFHLGGSDKNILSHYKGKISYYGIEGIKNEYEEYQSKLDRTEPPEIKILLNCGNFQPTVSSKKHKTFVSIISGDEIIRLREKHKYKLFDKNLRFGLGKNKINKSIAVTALSEPDKFYFYNNGITITSKGFKYKQTSSSVKIEFPQIINGAQTVNAIYSSFIEKKRELEIKSGEDSREKAINYFKKIQILFRIIQDSEKDGKKTSEFEEKVIRYNNSQNSIKETDFYANNPEQIKLQELFSKYGYFYEIKRGDREYLNTKGNIHNLLGVTKEKFKYWPVKFNIEKLSSLWSAYDKDPSKVEKVDIFGNDKGLYEALFCSYEFNEDSIKPIILALNISKIIENQAAIYSDSSKNGQIIRKINQIKEESKDVEKQLNNIHSIISRSYIFGDQIKQVTKNKDEFFEEKKNLIEEIEKYYFFSHGKYFTLAVFSRIIQKCNYLPTIVEYDIFLRKDLIEKKIVSPWLKIILNKIILPVYEEYNSDRGTTSVRNFYRSAGTWPAIKKRIDKLRFEIDEPLDSIFKLELKKI